MLVCTRTAHLRIRCRVVAFVADECFEYLDAPVCASPPPTRSSGTTGLEDAMLPQVDDIERDLEALLKY